jgi:hypothetical protein
MDARGKRQEGEPAGSADSTRDPRDLPGGSWWLIMIGHFPDVLASWRPCACKQPVSAPTSQCDGEYYVVSCAKNRRWLGSSSAWLYYEARHLLVSFHEAVQRWFCGRSAGARQRRGAHSQPVFAAGRVVATTDLLTGAAAPLWGATGRC